MALRLLITNSKQNAMDFIWSGVKQTAAMAASAAAMAGNAAKLKTELLMVDRDVRARKAVFGVELYDFINPLAAKPDFFAANDKMTDIVRGPFLAAQREIAALFIKRSKLKEKLAQAEVTRKAAFPSPAQSFGEAVVNAAKTTGYASNEVKIKTEISMVDSQINYHKEEMGVVLFDVFMSLEDKEGWLPTIREVRSMYDRARQDIDKLEEKRVSKEKELEGMGIPVPEREAPNTSVQGASVSASGLGLQTQPYAAPAPSNISPPPSGNAGSYGSTVTTTTAAPYSAPAPAPYTTSSVPDKSPAMASVFSDPFGSSAPSVQPAVGGVGDPFAAGYRAPIVPTSPVRAAHRLAPVLPANNNIHHDPFDAPMGGTSATTDPFTLGGAGTMQTYDPFGTQPLQPQPVHDPFSAQPTSSAADPFSFKPPQQDSSDPFAGL